MKQDAEILRRANVMAPLIRSIAREAADRHREIRRLEAELAKLLSAPGEPVHDLRRVESELFGHRRAVERIQKELGHIGCSLDAEHPDRVVCSLDDREVSFEERLDETGYRPDRSRG